MIRKSFSVCRVTCQHCSRLPHRTCHVMSCNVKSCHVMLCHTTSTFLQGLPAGHGRKRGPDVSAGLQGRMGGSSVFPLPGEFHDQADAKRIVIRGLLRGHDDTPCGRPNAGWPVGQPCIWCFHLSLISNTIS
jgi:hypothetical protein